MLGGGNVWNMPELILIVRRFNQDGIANLPLLIATMTLQPFPHIGACMKHMLAGQKAQRNDSPTTKKRKNKDRCHYKACSWPLYGSSCSSVADRSGEGSCLTSGSDVRLRHSVPKDGVAMDATSCASCLSGR
jgi:hypothetical protein